MASGSARARAVRRAGYATSRPKCARQDAATARVFSPRMLSRRVPEQMFFRAAAPGEFLHAALNGTTVNKGVMSADYRRNSRTMAR